MLVAARARLELKHPAELVRVQTFGSPPVLAQEPSTGASSSVLQVSRLAEGHCVVCHVILWVSTVIVAVC